MKSSKEIQFLSNINQFNEQEHNLINDSNNLLISLYKESSFNTKKKFILGNILINCSENIQRVIISNKIKIDKLSYIYVTNNNNNNNYLGIAGLYFSLSNCILA